MIMVQEEWSLMSEPEAGGVGVAGGSGVAGVTAGLAGMALLWAAAAPGCCWGAGDGFSIVGGGGGATTAHQSRHNRNRNQHMHQFISRINQKQSTGKVKAESRWSRGGAGGVRTCWLVARHGGRWGDDGDGGRG